MIKNRLKEMRKKHDYTLDDIQKMTGIKRGTYSNYENGNTEPKIETWKKLANFFGVSVSYLQGIQSNYTQRDVFRILNNNYFNSDNNLYDIHEILEEVFTFSPDIPRLDSLFSRDEIKKFTTNVQKYWQKYFSFLANHKLIQTFYELPISPQGDIVLKEAIFNLLEDHVILITETTLSKRYEDNLQDFINTFDSSMMYETRFGNKQDIISLTDALIKEAKKFKKDIKNLPDSNVKVRPKSFLNELYFNNYDEMLNYAKNKAKTCKPNKEIF